MDPFSWRIIHLSRKKMSTSISLDNYKNEHPTRSCFLDGRYIPIVLKNVKEFHTEPILLSFKNESLRVQGSYSIHDGMNIIRIIILTQDSSHSALIWIDTRDRTITFTDVREEVSDLALDWTIQNLLRDFFSDLKYTYKIDIAYISRVENENCEAFGYCNAYVIKQVIDYLQKRDFDPSEIRRFSALIERKYSHLLDPNTEPEVEYHGGGGGYHGGGGRGYRGGYGVGGAGLGLGVGLLGGLAIGSAASYQPYPYYPQPYPYYPQQYYPQPYY